MSEIVQKQDIQGNWVLFEPKCGNVSISTECERS
jgi:hypothetical protein